MKSKCFLLGHDLGPPVEVLGGTGSVAVPVYNARCCRRDGCIYREPVTEQDRKQMSALHAQFDRLARRHS